MMEPYFLFLSFVDSAAHKSMFRYDELKYVERLPYPLIFHQGGAPAHTSSTAKEYLSRKLGNDWICRRDLLTGQHGLLI